MLASPRGVPSRAASLRVPSNASASALVAKDLQCSRPSTAPPDPAPAAGGIPRLFNKRLRHVEPACHRESGREAECQLSTSRTTVN
jgi:hypothetical protein